MSMKEFVLIFRNSVNEDFTPSPEQMPQVMTDWMGWMGSIAGEDKLANNGNRLSMSEGKTVKSVDLVTDGPYTEVKEFINGFRNNICSGRSGMGNLTNEASATIRISLRLRDNR